MSENSQPHNPLAGVDEILDRMGRVGWNDTFSFSCHKELSCWTVCCRQAEITLTPYDVLRLKNRLGMRSGDFLEKHGRVTADAGFGLPAVRLKMNGDGACPFVTDDGCTVYSDRPTTCRLYPLGHGVSSGTDKARGESVFFKIEEDHCLGWGEPKTWRLDEWVVDQGAKEYNYYNAVSPSLSFHPKLDPKKLDDKKLGMILMALYDLDKFREFVFGTTFLERFEIEKDTVDGIRENDEELLKFGVRWIEFSILGAPVIDVRGK
ncbi:MAG: YkgJ family cysteine cluster protein [Candidatus Nitrospinota bacterium M3_3B_026]